MDILYISISVIIVMFVLPILVFHLFEDWEKRLDKVIDFLYAYAMVIGIICFISIIIVVIYILMTFRG